MLRSPAVAALLAALALAACGSTTTSTSTGPAPGPAAPGSPGGGAPAAAAPVGTATFTVTASPDRELPAIAWYPAQQAGAGAAPVLGKKLPVVVFSHGLGGKKEHASFLAERVAAAGYLVVAIDHVGDGIPLALQRPVDVSRTIDRIAARGAEPAWLADLADLEHVGVYGHSFGGYTALAVAGAKIGPNPDWTALCAAKKDALGCPAPPEGAPQAGFRDPRVDVAIAAAPGAYFQLGRAGAAAIATPVLVLAGTKDRITVTADAVRPLYDHVKQPRWYLELEHGNHFTFVDLCPKLEKLTTPSVREEVAEACQPDAPMPLREAHALIGDAVVATLDHTLKGAAAPDLAALAKARHIAARTDAGR